MFSFFKKKKALSLKPKVAVIDANPVLDVLDKCAERCTFPMLDNGYVYLAASRLSIYHGGDDWAIVVEVFGFSPRAGMPDLTIHTFGNNLRNRKSRDDYVSEEAYENYLKNNEFNEYKSFYPIGGDDIWINPEDGESVTPNTSLLLRGKNYKLPDVAEYLKHDVILEQENPLIYELCRYLSSAERKAILATDDERRYNVPDHLVEILCLNDWEHPDLADGEKPSQVESFQQLSKVLMTGDISYYKPSVAGNTHWKNWPDSGLL